MPFDTELGFVEKQDICHFTVSTSDKYVSQTKYRITIPRIISTKKYQKKGSIPHLPFLKSHQKPRYHREIWMLYLQHGLGSA